VGFNLDAPNPDVTFVSMNMTDDVTSDVTASRTLDNIDNPLIVKTNNNGDFWFMYGHQALKPLPYSIIFDSIIIYYNEL
jgi:hypothetical protein